MAESPDFPIIFSPPAGSHGSNFFAGTSPRAGTGKWSHWARAGRLKWELRSRKSQFSFAVRFGIVWDGTHTSGAQLRGNCGRLDLLGTSFCRSNQRLSETMPS